MNQVELYTTTICGFCHAAKRLLNSKGVNFVEFNVMINPKKRAEMEKRSNGGRTVPQIFIGNKHVGGFDDLNALNSAGKLDGMLKS